MTDSLISRWETRNGRGRNVEFTDIYPTEALPNTNPKSKYVVKVKVMFGDADFYEDVKFEFTPNEEREILRFLNFLNQKVATAYPNGRGGDDKYESVVEGWNEWFGVDEDGNYGRFCDYWPSNWDLGGESTLENVDVTYYNSDGVGFSVAVD